MFRKVALALVFFTLASVSALAADFNGKWNASVESPRGTQTIAFDFHVDGAKLTGTVTSPRGSVDISNGKIDGNKFSFSTTAEGPNGSMTTKYEGTVEGSVLKGTSAREGGQRSFPFEAKKQ